MEIMPYVATGSVNRQEIEAAVQRSAQALAPSVVRIRYNFGPDWDGEPSVFFRVVIADEFGRNPKLSDLAQTVSITVRNETNTDELGLHSYFDFRTVSDQNQINEPEWA